MDARTALIQTSTTSLRSCMTSALTSTIFSPPLKEDARKKTGAEAVVKAVRFLGGKSNNLGAQLNWFENKVVQVAAVPQAKIFVYGSYELSIHQGPSSTASSGYRLELRLYSSEGAQILAASDEPLKGGPKIRLKV